MYVEGGPSLTLPVNAHPWRVGVASDGGSRFRGTIVQPRSLAAHYRRRSSPARRDQRGEGQELRAEELTGGCTVAAWIKPAAGEAGGFWTSARLVTPTGSRSTRIPVCRCAGLWVSTR